MSEQPPQDTPWADPTHSVIGDVQDLMRRAESGELMIPVGPTETGSGRREVRS